MNQSQRNKKKKKRRRSKSNQLTASVAFQFADIEQAFELEAKGKVPQYRMHAYSGGFLRVEQFPGEKVVVDLSTASWDTAEKTPNYLRHNKQAKVGETTERKIEATHIEIAGELNEENQYRAEIVAAHKNNKRWQGSIGAKDFSIERVPDGERRKINNRVFVGPFLHAKGAKITEVSFVDQGGDLDNHVSLAAQKQKEEEIEMNAALKALFDEKNLDPKTATVEELTAALKVEMKPVDEKVLTANEIKAEQRKAAAEESERIAGIQKLCASGPKLKIEKNGEEVEVDLAAHAIREEWDLDKTELKAKLWDLDQGSPTATPAIHNEFTEQKATDVLEASLAINQFGVPEDQAKKFYSDETLSKASELKNRRHSLHSLMHNVIQAAGMSFSGQFKSAEFWNKTLEAAAKLEASGTTTLSLPNLFENVLNKSLLNAFQLVNTTWPQICSIVSVNDFKPTSFVRLTADGGYRKIGKDGEIKHMSMTDSKFTVEADTYGAIISLTRKDIINDDLGGLVQRSQFLGQAAATKIEEEFYKLLLGNAGSFFSVANKNLLTGAGSALDDAGVKAACENFANRVNANNKPIMTAPSRMLVPVTRKTEADVIFGDEKYEVGTSAKTREYISNKFRGMFEPVSSPYINNTLIKDSEGKTIPNQSDKKWWLFVTGNPTMTAIRMAFLNGIRMPYVETDSMSFEKLGMQTRSYHDFGVAFGDPEAALQNNGE